MVVVEQEAVQEQIKKKRFKLGMKGKNNMNPIEVGDEVTIRWQGEQRERLTAVVLKNTKDSFCFMTKDGTTYDVTRAMANPMKTGRKFEEAKALLRAMNK